jgi:hypothetical protein
VLTLVTGAFQHHDVPVPVHVEPPVDLGKQEKERRLQLITGMKKGSHMRAADFPKVELTTDQQAEFDTRVLVICGSITSDTCRRELGERMKLWSVKTVDMFLSDRPFRCLKDTSGQLYDFDSLTTQ